MTSYRDIIDAWPSRAVLAQDLGQKLVTVHKWYARGSIPGQFDCQILVAAPGRGVELTAEGLAELRRSTAAAK